MIELSYMTIMIAHIESFRTEHDQLVLRMSSGETHRIPTVYLPRIKAYHA